MEILRVGSLNVNGMRDMKKRVFLSEIINLKELNVIFLQETHSNLDNEGDWGLWWKGEHFLSHGNNLSAGVAIFFAPSLNLNILWKNELEPGRLLIVRAEIHNMNFIFVNIYAPNLGIEIRLFSKLEQFLRQQHDGDFVVLGGDWNCTLDFIIDRNGEEPHQMSAICLARLVNNFHLSDVWREKNPLVKQYSWVSFSYDTLSAARLDRFYLSHNMRNRTLIQLLLLSLFQTTN